ncbi:hypothetical protein BU26DRAFT_11011 [Trematosphaeria pertusa]|uniref:Uncharacterized protein n=1 Tax=Trematosphaeria pertusa TaxID=390896 RepID=A0A6A6J065_9PLEO|nr:uncharacterized protein BU26DRAFT_11011 [Trematosphaeria pertusa]KAF2255888.1 hypothetical protein BU26DRAFT_11011 [Trematosphaeria pertusa]
MKEPFPDKFALARCLDGYIGGVLDDSEKNNLELKMLFGLLKALQKNSHQELHRVLKELGFEENNKLTDLRKLGNGFSDLVESTDPFLLARHMHIPFYIMKRIVSQMTAREERAARRRYVSSRNLYQTHSFIHHALFLYSECLLTWDPPFRAIQEERKAQERAGRGGEPNTSYKCRVLLSCFVWMGQLSLGGSLDRVMQKVQLRLADDEERNAFEWPFSAPARFNILVNGEETSEEDANDMDVIWDWFERQEEHSLFSFVFRISRLGVVGSFPDDLTLLRKEDYSRHESSSY